MGILGKKSGTHENEEILSTNGALHNLLVIEDGNIVGVQYPISTNGDSVYVKDIWVEESDMFNFNGDVTDLFDDLHTAINDVTSNNPKELFIHFNRTIVSNAIGLGAYGGGDFSNVQIEIFNSGDIATTVIDESADNTKYTSKTFQFPATPGFNGIKLTFHTADPVSLSNMVVLKTIGVVARLQATKPDNTIADINATAGGNLKISLEELESGISVNGNTQLKITQFDQLGNELFNSLPNAAYVASMRHTDEIAKGDLAGLILDKFGERSNVSTVFSDIFSFGANVDLTLADGVAQPFEIVSDSTDDTLAGIGAQTVTIGYIDNNGAMGVETVNMNGTTPVALSSYKWANRAFVASAGTSRTNVGNITIRTTAAALPASIALATYCYINAGEGQTLISIFMVPNDVSGTTIRGVLIKSIEYGCGKGEDVECRIRTYKDGVLRTRYKVKVYQTTYQKDLSYTPVEFDAGTIVIMQAKTSVGTAYVSATIDGEVYT